MTQEQLQLLIDQFDEQTLKEQAIFGIFQFGGGQDESFIRANKEGLALYAFELLQSAKKMDDESHEHEDIASLDFNKDWIDENSDVVVYYIESVTEKHQVASRRNYKQTTMDKLVPAGCVLLLAILAISTIVGFITLCQWLF